MSESKITQEEIEYMQNILVKNPIDHKYDEECEYFDCDVPPIQLAVRLSFKALKEMGKLPQGVAWIEEELKRNS